MKIALTIIFLVGAFLAIGQEKRGVITTLDNETLVGSIDLLGPEKSSRICRFKEGTSTEVVEYTPEQIISYQIIGENPYFSGAIDDSGVIRYYFFELITGGKLKLFAASKMLVVSSEDQKLIKLTSQNYKEVLTPHLSGCAFTQSALRKLRFEKAVLTRIVRTYNECIKSGSPETFRPLKQVTASYGPFVGLESSTISFGNNTALPTISGHSFSNVKPLNFGAELWLNFPNFSSRLQLVLGVYYSNCQFNGVTRVGGTDYLNNLYVSEFKVPIRVQYPILQKRKVAVFVAAGAGFSIISGFHSSQLWDTKVGNDIYINEISPLTDMKKGVSLYGGIGSTFEMAKGRKIVISCSYMSCSGNFSGYPDYSISATFSSFSFTTGFLF